MKIAGRGWVCLSVLLSASATLASAPRPGEPGARVWVLTSSRLLELDAETGQLVGARPVREDEQLLDRGESAGPLLSSGNGLQAPGSDPGAGFAAAAGPFQGDALATAVAGTARSTLVAFSTGLVRYSTSGALEESVRFPFGVTAVAIDGAHLWGFGKAGGFRIDVEDPTAAPFELDTSAWSGVPSVACRDELADLVVVAEEGGLHWLDPEGHEVAFTPLRQVEQLACGHFGRVWASGEDGTVLLESIGTIGGVEAAVPPRGAASPALAADPRDFAALTGAGGTISRRSVDGSTRWRVRLPAGEVVRGLAAQFEADAPVRGRHRDLRLAKRPPVLIGKSGPDDVTVHGRTALVEPGDGSSGSGDPVASATVTLFDSDVLTTTSATDGSFTTAPFAHVDGRQATFFASKETPQGTLKGDWWTFSMTPGQTYEMGDLLMVFDCNMAFEDGLFPANALNGEVRAMAFFDDGTGPALYVGGTFTTAGGTTVNRVARWNGTTWSALGSGLTITSGTASVDSFVVFDDGSGAKLYAGGKFNRSGSTTINNIAKWTGTAWTQVGSSGLNSQVLALAVHNSQLYAGGAFTKAGTVTMNRLARWTGSSWAAVGNGLNNTVKALASYDDGTGAALYVGGTFTQAGGTLSVSRIAKWDGSSWSALDSGVTGGSTIQVNALLSSVENGDPTLYVGGRFTTAGGTTVNDIARWKSGSWEALDSGLGVEVNALAMFDDGAGARLYAAGSFTSGYNRLARFNGSYWDPIGAGLNGNASRLGAGTVGSTPSLFVGGAFTTADGVAASRLARLVRPLTCADPVPPHLLWVEPRSGDSLGSSTPTLRFGAYDWGSSGIDTASLEVLVNGQVIPSSCTWSGGDMVAECTTGSLGGGTLALASRIQDLAGNWSGDNTITVTISDSTPPTISFVEPAEGAVLADAHPVLRLAYSDAGSGVDTASLSLTRDGSPLAVECQPGAAEAICIPSRALPNGATSLVATIRDLQGNVSAPATLDVTLAAPPPATTELRGTAVFESGAPAAGALVWLDGLVGTSTTAAADGQFSIAGIRVSSNPRVSLSASLSSGGSTYLAFLSDIAPVANGVTDVGQVILKQRCDSFFTPLPLAAGGAEVGGGTALGGAIARLAVYDDGSGARLFAGGDFNYGVAGSLPRIAEWGPRGWEWTGAGLGGESQPVADAFAVFDDGSGPALFVGGGFTSAGGVPAVNLAKWNGKEWQEVGRGLNGRVTGLAVFDDGSGPALFVAGDFTRVQTRRDWSGADVSLSAQHVAKWDGEQWASVASPGVYNYRAFQLSALQGPTGTGLYLWELYGGGLWQLVAGNWQPIDFPPEDGPVLTSVASATIAGTPRVFFAGYGFGVQEWTGSAWLDTGADPNDEPTIVGYADASGSYLFETSQPFVDEWSAGELRRWNGTSWSGVLAAEGGQLEVLTGLEAQPILVRIDPFARWENGAWVPFPLAVDTEGPVTSVAIAEGAEQSILFAGPTRAGGVVLDGSIGRWDGSAVSSVGAGLTGGGSKVVQAFEGTTKHVYGIAEAVGQVAEWNGSGWTPIGSPLGVEIHDVDWVDIGDGPELYAGGSGVYRWSGSFWYSLDAPAGIASSIEAYQGQLYAVIVDGFTGGLYHWNGTAWQLAWASYASEIKAIDGYLYEFNGGSATSAWNGSAWSHGEGPACGVYRNRFISGGETPYAGSVHALEGFNDGTGSRLLIGGDYASLCTSTSGHTLYGIVPGYTNINLGTGVDGPAVRALAAGRWNGSPAVAVGGDFATAGGKPSGKLALWHASPSWGSCSPAGQPPKITITSPPPVTSSTVVTLVGRVDEPATLEHDGAEVPLAADLSFSIPGVTLVEGTNTFFFEAVDRSGMRGSLTYQVVRDSMPPAVTFVDPPSGATVYSADVALDLTLVDALSGVDTSSLAVALNGGPVAPAACNVRDGRARCSVNAQEGPNTATATIRDRAGNLSTTAQLAFQVSAGAGNGTQLVGSVRHGDGSIAAGARVHVLGRLDAAGTSQPDGTFSIAVAGVADDRPWTVVAELTEGSSSLVGFVSGIVPVPGASTSAGDITLRTACDGELATDLFGTVGVAGRVRALAVFDDGSGAALYVGGAGLRYDGTSWHYLLRWDGQHLTTLPSDPNGDVNALAVFDGGGGPRLVAGGRFTSAGGVTVKGLAQWDGQAWSNVGGGVDGCHGPDVETLAVYDFGAGPVLYAGGDITSAGAALGTDLVVAWDGQAWTTFGPPSGGCGGLFSSERSVFALARYDDGSGPALYAAGSFDRLGGVAAARIAKRVGGTWAPLSFGLGRVSTAGTGLPSVVTSLAVFDGGSGPELYAAGAFNRAGNTNIGVDSIVRWDGHRWESVGGGLASSVGAGDFGSTDKPTGLQALAVYDDGTGAALYAAGWLTGDRFASIARWDGQQWKPVGAGLSDAASGGMALAPFAGELYVGGGFASSGGHGVNGLARWDGQVWRPLGIGFDRPVRALAVHDDGTGPALYAGGEFTSFGETALNHVARLDGQSWSPLGGGTDGDVLALESLTDASGSFLYAGGAFNSAGATPASRVARWGAGSWQPLGTGIDAAGTVYALAAHDDGSGTALYVGGHFTQAGGLAAANLARWRAGTWAALAAFNGDVKALRSATVGGATSLFAGGAFNVIDSTVIPHVARWDGISWSPVGSGRDGAVEALEPWQGGRLAAAGSFSGRVAFWDGTQWSLTSTTPDATVSALARWDDGGGDALFAGGAFGNLAAGRGKGVASWSGSSWSALGLGITGGAVLALQGFEDASGPALFLGGSFPTVDGVGSFGMAKWLRPLICVDQNPPLISIDAPAAGLVRALPPLIVSYSDSYSGVDASSLQWTLDGGPLAASCTQQANGSTCIAEAPLADGPHSLQASVADVAGNRGTSDPIAVTVDGEGPEVAFTAPSNDAIVTNANSPLTFSWSDAGSAVDLDGFGFFFSGPSLETLNCNFGVAGGTCTPTSPFGDGRWTARLSITDQAGNLSQTDLAFTVETRPPVLDIVAPAEGSGTNLVKPPIQLSLSDAGTGIDTGTLELTANGSPLAASCTFGLGTATCVPVAELPVGPGQLTATVRDLYGRQAALITRNFTIALDFTAPAISVSEPQDGVLTTASAVSVAGSLSEAGVLTLNGTVVPVGPDLTFAQGPVPLVEGVNALHLVATDAVGNQAEATVTVRSDSTAPTLTISAPAEGAAFDPVARPVKLVWSDAVAGVDFSTLAIAFDGTPVSPSCVQAEDGATCAFTTAPSGAVTLSASVSDRAGNPSAPAVVHFDSVVGGDVIPPDIEVLSPQPGSSVRVDALAVAGRLSEPATLTLDGAAVDVGADLTFTASVALAEGANVFHLRAVDTAANAGTFDLELTLDTQSPASLVAGLVSVTEVGPGSYMVAGLSGASPDSQPGTVVMVRNRAQQASWSLAVAGDGSFSGPIEGLPGDPVAMAARDLAGNESAATDQTLAGTDPVPVDPAIVAPVLDPSVPASLCAASSFLWSGAQPVQFAVQADAIDCSRVAVLRGQVIDGSGAPLADVRVSVDGHPELGLTLTRADGVYDLAVMGGGPVTLLFGKPSYLPARRSQVFGWGEWGSVATVALVHPDTQVTLLDLTAETPIQVARGTAVSDTSGSRQATLLVPQGTGARARLPSGDEQQLTTLHIRATEYSTGAHGEESLPAALPAGVAYGYSVELSADEVDALGADGVELDRPLPFYVEDFLGIPAGQPIPVGSFDRATGAWAPEPNGRVVRVLSVSAGEAVLDVDGADQPATANELDALGITSDELATLAGLYQPGQLLWRIPVHHFSLWSVGWTWLWLQGALGPPWNLPKEGDAHDIDHPTVAAFGGSIEVENQTLGESLSLTGSPLSLQYSSSLAAGRKAPFELTIPLTDAAVPDGLIGVELELDIAGRTFEQSFSPAPSQAYTFSWDGRDRFGQVTPGRMPWVATVTYLLPAYYGTSGVGDPAWGGPGGLSIDAPTVGPERWSRRSAGTLGHVQAQGTWGLGGWGLSNQLVLDVEQDTVYYPDGRQRRLNSDRLPGIMSRVAGIGTPGATGDGGLARQAELRDPAGISVMHDGSLLVADRGNCRVRTIDRQGVIRTIAGTICDDPDLPVLDGGPATEARLNRPEKAVEGPGPDYLIYIADADHDRIRRIERDGTIRTFAGTGRPGCQDGGIENPMDIAFDAEGNLLVIAFERISGHGSCRGIYRISSARAVTRLAGSEYQQCPESYCTGYLRQPKGIAAAANGGIYFTDANNLSLRPPQGLGPPNHGWNVAGINRFYGSPEDQRLGVFAGDGLPASFEETRFFGPWGVAVGGNGTVYIADYLNTRVRSITPDGIVHTVAGGGPSLAGGGDVLATDASLGAVTGVAVDPAGKDLYFTDSSTNRVYRVRLPNVRGKDELQVPSEDGALLYVFDSKGHHLRTEDSVTRRPLWTFHYGTYPTPSGAQAQLLTEAEDAFGNVTRVERGGNGEPSALVAPFGQRTTISLDEGGYLESVSRPLADGVEQLAVSMDEQGLLRHLEPPKLEAYDYTYDAEGRLTQVDDPEQGQLRLTYEETAEGHTVGLVTAEGRTSLADLHLQPERVEQRLTAPDATLTTLQRDRNGLLDQVQPDASESAVKMAADPRLAWGGGQLDRAAVFLGSGTGYRVDVAHERAASPLPTNDDGDQLPPVTDQTDTVTVNGRATSTTYSAASSTVTTTTPEGRTFVAVLDSYGRVSEAQAPGLLPVDATYDARGRLSGVSQGTGPQQRTSAVSYDPDSGFVKSVTDPEQRETRYERDAVGRVTKTTLPDLREIHFTYDLDGNLTGVTPPTRPQHSFDHNGVSQVSEATAPPVGGQLTVTQYSYNRDHQLKTVTLPDGRQIEIGYDDKGRPGAVTSPSGTTSYSYDGTGKLATIAAPGDVAIGYTYDGPWLSAVNVGGPFTASVHFEADRPYPGAPSTNFWLGALEINGQPATRVELHYDLDGVPTLIGQMLLYRDGSSGRLLGTDVLTTGERFGQDDFGELTELHSGYVPGNGTPAPVSEALLDASYQRDKLGRITHKTETTRTGPGAPPEVHSFDYTYDAVGHLTEVKRDGVVVESYVYDGNGNRTSWTTGYGSGAATYDAQDRLVNYGALSFTYGRDGELESKSLGAQTTAYTYDAFSTLRAVRLADGIQIEYLVDGLNHRIGKKIDGTLVQRFLYAGGLSPIAELDAAGNVTTQYVYGAGGSVPDYFVRGGVTYRIFTDHLGSVRYVVNAATGAVVQRMEYDSFGRVTLDTSPGFQPFGFAGGLYDYQTGLVRFGARDYDAETGRWTSKDPIGFAGGDTNLYGYTMADPVNSKDPTGLCEDPGGPGTRICIEAFIPTPTFGGFMGDGRGASPDGGTYRTMQTINVSSTDGRKVITEDFFAGTSMLGLIPLPTPVPSFFGPLSRTAEVAHQEVTATAAGINVSGEASDGLLFGAAPNLEYNLRLVPTQDGFAVSGSHTRFPSLEVWVYENGKDPYAAYIYNAPAQGAVKGMVDINRTMVVP